MSALTMQLSGTGKLAIIIVAHKVYTSFSICNMGMSGLPDMYT